MTNPDGVLAAIDACLDDYAVSDDAMRWAPGEPDPTPEGPDTPDDGLSLWGEYLSGERLYRTTSPPYRFVVRQGEPLIPAALADFSVSLHAGVTAFAEAMGGAAEAVAVFGKVMLPALAATRDAFHALAYGDDRKHYRRCPTCNPRGFPKPLPVNGHEYHRRQRRRNRR